MKEDRTKDVEKQPIPDGLIIIPKKETSKLQKPKRMPKENPNKQELLQQIKELKEHLCEAKKNSASNEKRS